MKKAEIAGGVVHNIPDDLEQILLFDDKILQKWNSLTALARNEWICWLISVKKAETREKHLACLSEDIIHGKKRPCCWQGCTHR